ARARRALRRERDPAGQGSPIRPSGGPKGEDPTSAAVPGPRPPGWVPGSPSPPLVASRPPARAAPDGWGRAAPSSAATPGLPAVAAAGATVTARSEPNRPCLWLSGPAV